MTVRTATPAETRTAAFGLAATAVVVVGVMILVSVGTADHWGAFVVGLVLVTISIPLLRNSAVRHGERALLWIFVLGLLLRIVGAVVRSYVDFEVFGGISDANYYHQSGVSLSEKFHTGNFDTGLPSLTGTHFIRYFTGIVYTVIGPQRLAAFILYAWLGYWGSFFLYRAFTIALPEGRARSYAKFLFFLPSFLFWPSSIGKEAWMLMSLGIAALGAARFLSGRPVRGLATAALGLWLGTLVRPHVVGILGIALATAVLIRRPSKPRGYLTPVAKGFSLVAVAFLAFLLVGRTEKFLEDRGIETGSGVTSVLEQTSARADFGGSYNAPSIVSSPRRVPVAVVTVLYRPLIFEAHNTQALVSAAETAFLLAFSLARFRWVLESVRLLRRRPYLALCAAHTALMIFILSAVANFGLLARQRIQLLPFFLALLCVPPPSERDAAETAAATETGP